LASPIGSISAVDNLSMDEESSSDPALFSEKAAKGIYPFGSGFIV